MHKDITFSLMYGFGAADHGMLCEGHGAGALRTKLVRRAWCWSTSNEIQPLCMTADMHAQHLHPLSPQQLFRMSPHNAATLPGVYVPFCTDPSLTVECASLHATSVQRYCLSQRSTQSQHRKHALYDSGLVRWAAR